MTETKPAAADREGRIQVEAPSDTHRQYHS